MATSNLEDSSDKENNLVLAETSHPAVREMANLPVGRQIGVMLGLALSVAIGVAVVLWAQTPDYGLLYASVADKDVTEVLEALKKLNIDYKVETSSGAILVPDEDVHEARLRLAAQGFPKSNSFGFEILDQDSGFGTSKSVEAARFQRALENEIARSIMSIRNVKSARVHLALPKQSVFIRQRKKPSASILVDLYSGRFLEKGQIEAVVHLVASSVPMLEPEQVTVVDQRGALLNSQAGASEMYLTSKQFDYKKKVEEHLMQRVENILSPLVGDQSVRTQVTADVDFTVTERTQEQFNPDLPALRSEQTQADESRLAGAQGVPGALSNQPPAAGAAPEQTVDETEETEAGRPLSTSRSATRNYELDKLISHTRLASGVVRRITVAVVIDDKHILQEDGSTMTKPHSQEDLNRFTNLVKQAVGFDVSRADSVTVTNSEFKSPEPIEALPELPIWEQTWLRTLIKQLAAALVVLLLIFAVIRPAMHRLIAIEEKVKANTDGGDVKALAASANGQSAGSESLAEDQLTLGSDGEALLLEAPQSYEKRLEFAQKMVDDDPKRVAQVLKNWVSVDG